MDNIVSTQAPSFIYAYDGCVYANAFLVFYTGLVHLPRSHPRLVVIDDNTCGAGLDWYKANSEWTKLVYLFEPHSLLVKLPAYLFIAPQVSLPFTPRFLFHLSVHLRLILM